LTGRAISGFLAAMNMQGKVALITGGSRGIGRATARLLGARGASVVLNYATNAQAAAAVESEITGSGGKALAVQADVRSPDDVQRLVARTLAAFGRIDVLVNNAGGGGFEQAPFLATSWEGFAADVMNELKASYLVTHAVLPTMVEQRYGRIVFVGSGTDRRFVPGMISHGTGKAALVAFAHYVAHEEARHGVTVNVVSPGFTETEASAHQPAALKEHILRSTPLGRLGQAEDIARVIAFYASDESGFITAGYTPVDGGQSS
jgi:3-oxoacyl-[acyl-carrier protein] reductase